MDPISISVELELGSLLIAAVGALATWLHHRHVKNRYHQAERHHRDQQRLSERHHQENLRTQIHENRTIEKGVSAVSQTLRESIDRS